MTIKTLLSIAPNHQAGCAAAPVRVEDACSPNDPSAAEGQQPDALRLTGGQLAPAQ